MSLLDFSKNCDIITHAFSDDLLSYSLKDNKIIWEDDNEGKDYTIKQDIFSSSMSQSFWTPVFFSNDNLIENKIISHYGSVIGDSSFESGRIGIENFIVFDPKFKNWNVTNGKMVIDWILNRSRSPYSVEAGLMYWIRKTPKITGKITFFPDYSKLTYDNKVYIKLDNETVRPISPTKAHQASFDANGNLNFKYTENDSDIKVIKLQNPDFTLYGSEEIQIWIPDGDQLLYFTNQSEKAQNNKKNIACRSYISGSLYKYYNIFYNSLTASEKLIKVTDTRSTHSLRQYKKLAHSLSASPFNSEFFAALLARPSKDIKLAIDNYIKDPVDSITSDISKLKNILETISKEYSNYEINNNSNIVKNNEQLFHKLLSKYGAKLQLSGNATITYNPSLTYGDSIISEEIGDVLLKKSIKNETIISNKKIKLTKLSIETSVDPITSSIVLRYNDSVLSTIPLYDSVKPNVVEPSNINISLNKNNNVDDYYKSQIPNSPKIPIVEEDDPKTNIFYWGPKNIQNNMSDWLQYCPKLTVLDIGIFIKYFDPKFPNQAQELIEGEFVCTWEKISGPDCRFIDLSKTQTNKSYNRAYSNAVRLVPSTTGKYIIKCVVSSPYGSYTKIKTIFIVDGREQVEKPNTANEMIINQNFGTYSQNGLDNLFALSPTPIPNDKRITPDVGQYEAEAVPIKLNKDNLRIFIAGPDSIAIHRNGLFAPIRTNYYVEKPVRDRSIEKLNQSYNYLFQFNNDEKTTSSETPKPTPTPLPVIVPNLKDSSYSVEYYCNNTTIKLDRIILRNIRNNTKECSQCYSLYNPKFKSFISQTDRKPQFSRSNKNPEGFTLQRYLPDQDTFFRSDTVKYSYPNISTDIAPPIRTCGGYGYAVLDKLSIKDLDSLKRPERLDPNKDLVANNPKILPPATGYKLDYKDDFISIDDKIRGYKFCYQQNIMPEGSLEFNKGTFVPNSGWAIGDNRNLSSVLKFNPGARQSFSFAGPGILGIGNYTTNDSIYSNILSSSIELNINPSIRWDNGGVYCPEPDKDEANRNKRAAIGGIHNMKNQLKKELADQYIGASNQYNHGYRILNGGVPKRTELNLSTNSVPENDEFNINIDEYTNKFIYSFNVVGPNKKIELDDDAKEFIDLYQVKGIEPGSSGNSLKVRDFIEKNDGLNLRNPRINNLTIKDVEVKLNFLNYVNTKNLVIWLEVEFCSLEKENMKLSKPDAGATATPDPPKALPQIKANNNFIDQFISNDTHKKYIEPADVNNQFFTSENINVGNTAINEYLKKITDLNSTDTIGEKVILYLLNQETIQNKEYNFSVKFSDSANKNNVLYDHNHYSYGSINPDQNIISNNSVVNPSKHADQYDTYQNSSNCNLNKNNRLNINNNTFHKLADRKLFLKNPDSPRRGCNYLFPFYESSTKFTLKIAVLEEEDDMFPMDTIINNELYTNLSTVDTVITSANLFNNLCSWELILHTEDVKKPVTSQVNSLANYGGTDSLSLIEYGKEPSYPGYNFIANLENSKFLLPLVNMNAPTTFFQNYNACEYADNELIGKGTLINQPRFPTEALIFILAGTVVGGMTGSLVGVLVGGLGVGYGLGIQMILDYFKESRKIPNLELAQRETFDIEYDAYPFGSSDKILLNISKDGVFWYKIESSIFKLNNTPALPLKTYSLIKADNKLFRFNFDVVSKNTDIIDDIFLPYIIAKATTQDNNSDDTASYQNIDNVIYESFNFMSVNELVFANKLIHSENIFQYIKKPNQTLIIIDHTIPYYLISIGDNISLDCGNKYAVVKSKALMYKNSRYQTVLALDQSSTILSDCSSLLLPENVVVICGSENSTIEANTTSPVSLFGLVSNQPPNDTIPDLTFSTNSLGSYGNGSSVKDKNILSRKVQINHLESIYNQLNSFNNDKFYYNEASLVLPSGDDKPVMAPSEVPTGLPISIKSALESYPVYYDNTTDNILNNNFYHVYNNTFNSSNTVDNTDSIKNLLNNINTSIKNNRSYTKDNKCNIIYFKFHNSDIINKLYRNTICPITIENNYSYKETIERITGDQLTLLTNRLRTLNNNSNSNLDPKIGNGTATSELLMSDSIFYIQQHYNSLPEDAGDCSRLMPTITCYKDNTYSKLQKLYREKNDILQLLGNQTIKDSSGNLILDPEAQKYHTQNDGIIPDKKVNIVSNNDNSISISYENISNNYYWINIDPKQSISIAEEMRPRILKSVKYICNNTNPSFSAIGGGELLSFNNICADSAIGNLQNDILEILSDSRSITYTFKQKHIDEQKTKWKDRVSYWDTQVIERKFRINAEKSIPGVLSRDNDEILVTAIETYEIALDTMEAYIKNGKDAALSDSDIVSLLIEENIIKNDFSGDIYGGLNKSKDTPLGKPTRVYNIFNLDDTDKLKVQFRKAPRSIRGIDAIGTILRYGENMSYRPQNRPPLDPLDAWGVERTEGLINNFYQWKCLQKDPFATEQSGGSLLNAKTPEFFQLLNEMIFRSFFGSVDEIENKTTQLRSLYDFEMIPYEYFTNPPPK